MSKQQIRDNLVILQYEAEKERQRRINIAKTKPLHKALKYAGNKWGRTSRTCQHMNWYAEDWPVIVDLVCQKFGGLRKITDIDPDYIDRANDYAIKLINSRTPIPGEIDYQERRMKRRYG